MTGQTHTRVLGGYCCCYWHKNGFELFLTIKRRWASMLSHPTIHFWLPFASMFFCVYVHSTNNKLDSHLLLQIFWVSLFLGTLVPNLFSLCLLLGNLLSIVIGSLNGSQDQIFLRYHKNNSSKWLSNQFAIWVGPVSALVDKNCSKAKFCWTRESQWTKIETSLWNGMLKLVDLPGRSARALFVIQN